MGYATMYDDAHLPTGPDQPPATDAVLIYAGGANASHVWTEAEIDAQGKRSRMPAWVYGVGQSGTEDGRAFHSWLASHGVPKGSAVMVDMETEVDHPYLEDFADQLGLWTVLVYGSTGSLFANPGLDGWFPADWTGHPHLFAHPMVLATQYAAASLGQTAGPWDLSLLSPALDLWNPEAASLVHVTTNGELSLVQLARRYDTTASAILRVTLNHGGHHFSPELADYINNDKDLTKPVPKGIRLIIQPGPDGKALM